MKVGGVLYAYKSIFHQEQLTGGISSGSFPVDRGAGLYAPVASADTGIGQTTVVTDANAPNGLDVYGNFLQAKSFPRVHKYRVKSIFSNDTVRGRGWLDIAIEPVTLRNLLLAVLLF